MGRWLAVIALCTSCTKVGIVPVAAGFVQADASWFSQEQTLFLFYEVGAEQGIGDPSVVEITYATDTERVDWTPVSSLPTVHTHFSVDCGNNARCGSTSLYVPLEPRDVGIRLRYHRDGVLALTTDTAFNVVGPGPAHTHRSMVVYGVFNEANQRVQWRGRHQFPTVRNMRASELGLRREFTVFDQTYGTSDEPQGYGPYGYGAPCPGRFVDAGMAEVNTQARAQFNAKDLPIEASPSSMVCAQSTVTDATGTYTADATARKNPEVRSAFPILNSPVREATQLTFFLAPCDREISPVHEAMQRQRIFADDIVTTCTDDWQSAGFVDSLVVTFRDAVEQARPDGDDMVLVVGVHQDQAGVAAAVEQALAKVVVPERHRTTPRLSGAFVFDSSARGLTDPVLAQSTLWCPSTLSEDLLSDVSARSCPVLPDTPDLKLGPLAFGAMPILPTRRQYLKFVDSYSVGTAGRATELQLLTPEFATTAEHVDLGEYGVVTFLNGESIDAGPDDAFSYCVQEAPSPIVASSELMRDPAVAEAIRDACDDGQLPESICAVADVGLLPLEYLPDWHELAGESNYQVGLFWEFPFLFRMQYEAAVAGSVSAFGLSVPFGIGTPSEQLYGAQSWTAEQFSLNPTLSQCRRYCDAPTFDSAGVFHVTDRFRDTYAHACYTPRYPVPGDSGFPLDP
ncbi:MAG: hypothetical protein ACI9MC_001141 [Kiritimatiellia bacterium]|jgi:hypothetical protein